MPTLDELTNKTKKKFTKSEYRPWNYMEEIDKESNENQKETKKESNNNHIDIKSKSIGNQLKIKKQDSDFSTVNSAESKSVRSVTKNEKIVELPVDLETTLDVIFRLTGHQKRIFLLIVDKCMSRGMLSTGIIKGETLVEITETSMKMVKTSIQRLVEKKLIIRDRGKTGRGGFYSFKLLELVRNATIEYKRMIGIDKQLEIKKESNGIQVEIENKILPKQKISLPVEWENINISLLEDIGFKNNHLLDIFETGLSDYQMVQDSIFHFAYGIEHESAKYKQYDDLLNVLIGRLRKGKPWYEPNYRSPQELAQLKLLEIKKNELERKKRLEEEAYQLALNEWKQDLTSEEAENIAPVGNGRQYTAPQKARLEMYFREKIWPLKKSEFIAN